MEEHFATTMAIASFCNAARGTILPPSSEYCGCMRGVSIRNKEDCDAHYDELSVYGTGVYCMF